MYFLAVLPDIPTFAAAASCVSVFAYFISFRTCFLVHDIASLGYPPKPRCISLPKKANQSLRTNNGSLHPLLDIAWHPNAPQKSDILYLILVVPLGVQPRI
jgi:hypothetical protein